MISCHDSALIQTYLAELEKEKEKDLGTLENFDLLSAEDFLDQDFLKDQIDENQDGHLHEQAQVNMKIIDDFLAGIDFNIQFLITEISFAITGSR